MLFAQVRLAVFFGRCRIYFGQRWLSPSAARKNWLLRICQKAPIRNANNRAPSTELQRPNKIPCSLLSNRTNECRVRHETWGRPNKRRWTPPDIIIERQYIYYQWQKMTMSIWSKFYNAPHSHSPIKEHQSINQSINKIKASWQSLIYTLSTLQSTVHCHICYYRMSKTEQFSLLK